MRGKVSLGEGVHRRMRVSIGKGKVSTGEGKVVHE